MYHSLKSSSTLAQPRLIIPYYLWVPVSVWITFYLTATIQHHEGPNHSLFLSLNSSILCPGLPGRQRSVGYQPGPRTNFTQNRTHSHTIRRFCLQVSTRPTEQNLTGSLISKLTNLKTEWVNEAHYPKFRSQPPPGNWSRCSEYVLFQTTNNDRDMATNEAGVALMSGSAVLLFSGSYKQHVWHVLGENTHCTCFWWLKHSREWVTLQAIFSQCLALSASSDSTIDLYMHF